MDTPGINLSTARSVTPSDPSYCSCSDEILMQMLGKDESPIRRVSSRAQIARLFTEDSGASATQGKTEG
ncbi:hypothetical protein KIN20_034060 [Parelaphostrongylus tenuis]|uniref:Uncharacterized protein n=1 Tax=Parelaphostrongylus tenuis TaxID=148309 RepID=A0AAD5WIY7_PARTN|nr:hypothetical protein KIN20_034060 [Parelaphostrongylus tenuis]